jgi:hypothetical protein
MRKINRPEFALKELERSAVAKWQTKQWRSRRMSSFSMFAEELRLENTLEISSKEP